MKLHKLIIAAAAMLALHARADVITDWNQKTNTFISEARIGTPPAVRISAIAQTAAWQAVRSLPRDASVEAAVAAAHRTTLVKLMPAQQASIDAAYHAALAALVDGTAKVDGVAAGEKAAGEVLSERLADGAGSHVAYRPHTTPGTYAPTVVPAVPQWPQRKPWLLESADQFRPVAPPLLTSDRWARDFNEIKSLGALDSKQRSVEQTEIGRFWDYSLPAIYHGIMRSVALQPGRSVSANARLFAVAAQAMDDALIAVMDAKYTYNLWRPVTAIRNGDIDGHDGTVRDPAWAPLIDTPMHPEYPCAHCILAATVSTVLKAEARGRPLPVLSTSSPTAQGAVRRWSSLDAFSKEVALARIVAGVHYRHSTEVGLEMGRQIGEWAVQRAVAAAQ